MATVVDFEIGDKTAFMLSFSVFLHPVRRTVWRQAAGAEGERFIAMLGGVSHMVNLTIHVW